VCDILNLYHGDLSEHIRITAISQSFTEIFKYTVKQIKD